VIVERVTEVIKFADYLGGPYDTQATLQWISPTWVNIRNLSGTFNKKRRREIQDYLQKLGVERVTYIRYRRGSIVEHTVEVGKWTDSG
tara:strand:- start:23253 stop:23516 length:264 start_codon:yes stop_codon:yes gene_type:complete